MHHYLYKICNNITGEYYYGVHSTENLNDGYFGSGVELKRNIQKYGKENFSMHILEYKNTRNEILDLEQNIVNAALILDPLCLNLSLGGNGCPRSPGRATVRDKNGNCFTVPKNDPRIKTGELESINKGNQACKGRVAVTKNGTDKYCKPEELESYLADGWVRGLKLKGRLSPTKGLLHLHKNNDSIMVKPEELESYLADGWVRGRLISPCKDKILIKRNGTDKYCKPEELESYLADGWVRGGKSRNVGRKLIRNIKTGEYASVYDNDARLNSSEWSIAAKLLPSKIRGRININKHGVIKRILPEELESYLADGWVRGTGINPHKH